MKTTAKTTKHEPILRFPEEAALVVVGISLPCFPAPEKSKDSARKPRINPSDIYFVVEMA